MDEGVPSFLERAIREVEHGTKWLHSHYSEYATDWRSQFGQLTSQVFFATGRIPRARLWEVILVVAVELPETASVYGNIPAGVAALESQLATVSTPPAIHVARASPQRWSRDAVELRIPVRSIDGLSIPADWVAIYRMSAPVESFGPGALFETTLLFVHAPADPSKGSPE